nr:hypothetical protein [Tanacetum cinerariifolium]
MRGEKVVPAAAVGDIDGLVMPAVVVMEVVTVAAMATVVAAERGEGGSVVLVDRGVVVAAVAVGLWMVGRRVGTSDIVDRVDRVIRILFGLVGKSPPEKFSGGGGVVVAGRRWLPDFVGEKGLIKGCVCLLYFEMK